RWKAAIGLKPLNPQKGLRSKFTQKLIPLASSLKRPRGSFDAEKKPTKKSDCKPEGL
ncbi:hypothetical protein OnM2_107025, partial [Erysiphe neolycopersici]